MPDCPTCGKPIIEAAHLADHLTSLNCRMRAWKKGLERRGWRKARFGLRARLDLLGIPYELAPCAPNQGQCIYVPGWVHRVLRREVDLVLTFTGPKRLKRPSWLILNWLAAAQAFTAGKQDDVSIATTDPPDALAPGDA